MHVNHTSKFLKMVIVLMSNTILHRKSSSTFWNNLAFETKRQDSLQIFPHICETCINVRNVRSSISSADHRLHLHYYRESSGNSTLQFFFFCERQGESDATPNLEAIEKCREAKCSEVKRYLMWSVAKWNKVKWSERSKMKWNEVKRNLSESIKKEKKIKWIEQSKKQWNNFKFKKRRGGGADESLWKRIIGVESDEKWRTGVKTWVN